MSSRFSTLEALDFDGRRSSRWNDEQITPGGTAGLAIDPTGTPGVDLRVASNLASQFVVSHPVANYVRLTVTSNRDGVLFDGQWLVNAPVGGSLFANSLPVNFQTEGLRTLTLTARYGSHVVSQNKATGAREVRVATQDQEGRQGSVIGSFTVAPPPANPYPRIATFGAYSRDSNFVGGFFLGCVLNQVGNNSVIDPREIGCTIGLAQPTRYVAQLTLENPTAEAVSYDWTYSIYSPGSADTPK